MTRSGTASPQPPLDCRRQSVAVYSNWAQKVTVATVGDDMLTSIRPDDPTAATARVTVTIIHNGIQVYQTSWLAIAPDP